MLKRSMPFVLLVTILSLVSSVGWAQKRFPVKKIQPSLRTPLPKQISLPNASLVVANKTAPWTQMGETALREQKIHENCLRKILQTQKKFYERELAKHPPLVGENVKTHSAKLIYNGTELGVLRRGERIVMGSAYTAQGNLVAQLKGILPNGDPILANHLEQALSGYDIEMIILMIRSSATSKKPAKSRFIVYHVSTGKITNSIR